MTKTDRRKVIADRATAVAPRQQYLVFWMTRDTIAGTLSDTVKIWLARPTRFVADLCGPVGFVTWGAQMADGTSAYYQTWQLGWCMAEARVIPSDDLQCIRVGPEPIAEPVVS